MVMTYGVAPLAKDDSGEMRFCVMSIDHKTGASGQMIFGTEQDEKGFTESKLQKFLTDSGFSPIDIKTAIQGAKDKAAAELKS
jgi:hypothetical protein